MKRLSKMVVTEKSSCYVGPLPNIPNFRCLCSSNNDVSPEIPLLSRSSRPDYLNVEEVKEFQNFKIKAIIDCRSKGEYFRADGTKELDRIYKLVKVDLPYMRGYKPRETVKTSEVLSKPTSHIDGKHNSNINPNEPKHYFINFYTGTYLWTMYNRAPWYIRLYGIIFLLIDLLLNTGYKYFVRCFAPVVMNPPGIESQYVDMVEMSQRSICAVLKLLTDEENIPALINCAHGKDRTGIIVMLVLSCLGTSKEDIVNDYSESSNGLEAIKERVHREVVDKFHLDVGFTRANPQTMVKTLQHIDHKYGSVANYLESIGFSLDEQELLKKNLGRYRSEKCADSIS